MRRDMGHAWSAGDQPMSAGSVGDSVSAAHRPTFAVVAFFAAGDESYTIDAATIEP
jgi:hypothetical protein